MPLSRITNPFLGTSGYRSVTDFTATAGQTSFTVPSYAVGYIDVYRNGVKLAAADFTATSGTTVVLANPATLGDVITAISTYMGTATNLSVTGGTINGQLVVNSATGVNPFITQVNSTEVLRIDSAGNLGIGTTTTNSKLNIFASSTNTSVLGTYANIPLLLKNTSSTNNNWCIIGTQDAAGNFATFFGTQTTNQASALSDFVIGTNPGSGATERMRIDSSGKVGIGTSSPALTLSLSGGTGTAPATSGTTQNGTFRIRTASNGVIDFGSISATGAGWIQATDQTSLASNYDLLLNPNGGNVGIGTATPVIKLDVTGVSGTNGDARGLITVTDTSSFATGVGGGITFRAKYNTAGNYFDATNIKGIKENATDGNFAGAMVFATSPNGGSPTERMRIDSSGNLLVGSLHAQVWDEIISGYRTTSAVIGGFYSSSSSYTSSVIRAQTETAAGTGWYFFEGRASGGSFQYGIRGNGTVTTSDERRKKNIEPARSYLEDICKIPVVKYNWKSDEDSVSKELGWIAQDVQKVFPNMVVTHHDGPNDDQEVLLLKKEVFLPMLMKCIQEQQALITQLQADVAALKDKA